MTRWMTSRWLAVLFAEVLGRPLYGRQHAAHSRQRPHLLAPALATRGRCRAAHAAAHSALLAGDVRAFVANRLASQPSVPPADPSVEAILSGVTNLGPRAALLVIRGATNSVCAGARLHELHATCPFCFEVSDALPHLLRCRRALTPFCAPLGVAESDSLVTVLSADRPRAARILSAYDDFVSTAVVSQSEVVTRSAYVIGAVRAHPRTEDAAPAPRPRPRRRLRPDHTLFACCFALALSGTYKGGRWRAPQ